MPTLRIVSDTMTPGLRRQLKGISAGNRKTILSAIGKDFNEVARGTFGSKGANRPRTWVPLSAGYSKHIGGRKQATLVMTSAERMKIGKDASSPHLEKKISIQQVNSKSVTVVADSPYAAVHQLGKHGMPPRPFFPVTQKNRITEFAGKRITEIIKRMLKQFKAV